MSAISVSHVRGCAQSDYRHSGIDARLDIRRTVLDHDAGGWINCKRGGGVQEDVRVRLTTRYPICASGIRNPTGLGWEPRSGKLWAVANERDELGPNLVPDYLTSVKEGAFYGWPYSYYGQHIDPSVKPQRPDLVARAIPPDYALSSHVAPLGLAFSTGTTLPAAYQGGAFVGEHGSWDRNPLNGYNVIYVPFSGGHPSGPAQDVVTGFLDKDDHARGRPVGLAMDRNCGLLIADDLGNVVWRVSASAK
jgi:glucose/arabinose dehydrogenase